MQLVGQDRTQSSSGTVGREQVPLSVHKLDIGTVEDLAGSMAPFSLLNAQLLRVKPCQAINP